jgi:Uncharacterised nucleotidyltransferase
VPSLESAVEGTNVEHVLDAIAAYGFAGSRRILPVEPLDGSIWSAFLRRVSQQRLAGLLAAAINDAMFPVTEEQRSAVAELQTQVAIATLILERLLLDIADRFDTEALDFRVLKGSAVAHLDFPDPELRSFGDVDMLVRAADFGRAVAVLETMGGRRGVPELRPGFDRRFGKGAVINMPEDLEIDLHRTFLAGALGMTIDLDDLFKRKSPFILGDRELLALGKEERFLHACISAALGHEVSRHHLRDVAQMVLNNRLDTDRVVVVAERWKCGAVAARAIDLTWSTLDLADSVPLSAWAGRYQSRSHERRVLNSYVGGDGSYTRQAISAIRVIPLWRDKLAYARALLFPQQRHLDARSSGRFRHLWRGAGHLRGGHTS